MSMNMECYDLQHLAEDQKAAASLLRLAAETGRRIPAYTGTYSNLHFDAFQVITGGAENPETQELNIRTGHIHNAGMSLWQCRVVREITPAGSDEMDMKLLVEPVSGGNGFTVIEVMNSDILPSYAPGEIIEMQVIAKSLWVRFYGDRDHFVHAEEQRMVIPAGRAEAERPLCEGYPMPLGFLCSGYPETAAAAQAGRSAGRENLVYLRGTISDLTRFSVSLPSRYNKGAVRKLTSCEINTDFGLLEVMLSGIHREAAQIGRTVSVLCTLQGDAMMGDHDYGMIIDPQHDLMALRYAFSSGRMKRLLPVMAENCTVYSETGEQTVNCRENAVKYLESLYDHLRRQGGIYTLYGAADSKGRLVIAGTDSEKEGTGLLYIIPDFDEEGRIRSLRISGGSGREIRRYRSWLEMEENELIRKGISPAILKKERALSDFLNRNGRRDDTTWITGSILEEDVVLEYGDTRYEGIDRVMEFLEGVSLAAASDAGFDARPAYISGCDDLDFQYRPDDTVQGTALLSKMDESLVCFFVIERNGRTGRIDRIRGVSGKGYSYIIDYCAEWDTVPEKMKTGICRRE